MITRTQYLTKLHHLRDKNVIKIITGIRRCWKSTLFKQFQQELLDSGVHKKNIISLNLEEMENEALLERHVLNDYILRLADPKKKNYVFLDEIQNVPQFEKLIDSLFVKNFLDIYITGSNAYMLSSDLATFISGRYIEIKMMPFSFYEFSQNYQNTPKTEIFNDYLTYGGFPEVSNFLHNNAKAEIPSYLENIYKTVLEKDIKSRKGIRLEFDFNNLVRFAFDNIWSIVSPNKIANTLTQNWNKITHLTVESYLSALTDSFVLYQANRWDIKGKKLLQTLNKYYVIDIGLMRNLLGKDSKVDRGHILENIVYLELVRKNQSVWIWKKDNKEIDFVVKTLDGKTEYYQVAETMLGAKTRERELSSINDIKDHNLKFILTMDEWAESYNWINQINIIDWLLSN